MAEEEKLIEYQNNLNTVFHTQIKLVATFYPEEDLCLKYYKRVAK